MLVDSITKFNEALGQLSQPHTHIVVDLETTGLNPHSGDRMCGIALEAGNYRYYMPFRHDKGYNLPMICLDPLRRLLSRPDVTYVGWNYKFDLQFLAYDGFKLPNKIEDVMLAAHLMNENEYELDQNGKVKFIDGKPKVGYQLKRLANKYLEQSSNIQEEKLIEHIIKLGLATSAKKAKGVMWKLDARDVVAYAVDDVRLTGALREFYVAHLKNWLLYDLWKEVNEYALIITKAELEGMPINLNTIKTHMAEAKDMMLKLEDQMQQLAGYPINPNSPKQICALLGTTSSNKEHLEVLMDQGDPIAKIVTEYRQWSRLASAYYQAYIDAVDPNGFLHTQMHLIGTVSGRLSCSNPNLQAIPKQTNIYKVKNAFEALPGYYFVQADYSQAEMRLGTAYAAEEKMKEKIIRGADLHTETSTELGIPRDAAKRINFGVIYGIGKVSLAKQLKIDEKLAGQYLRKYHEMYPGFRILYKKCETMAEQRGYIRMWTGRVRRYDAHNPSHKAMSNLIQGGVAEMMRVVITELHRKIPQVKILLQVHDSIIFQVPKEGFDGYINQIRDIMENTPQFDVPMTVDIEYGETWGTTQKIKRTKENI